MSAPEAWNERSCAKGDPERFFPPGDITAPADVFAEAKAICRGCKVALPCLEGAMKIEANLGDYSRWGVFGGLSPAERSLLARGRTHGLDYRGPEETDAA